LVPLKVNKLKLPWPMPKFEPLIVTEVPTGPALGAKDAIDGPIENVNPLEV